MSAIVCGKRSIFEDIPASQVSKRIRFSASSPSPIQFSSQKPSFNPFVSFSQSSSNLIEYLKGVFPDMDPQLLERALEESGDDLDLAIRSLNELRLGSVDQSGCPVSLGDVAEDSSVQPPQQVQVTANGDIPDVKENFPKDGADWVDYLVREMMSASDMDDAKSRVSRVLEVLEKSIYTRASSDVAQSFHKENEAVKGKVEALLQENAILKRAVAIQHERQKEFEDKNLELVQLKQLVTQYQDQLRTLEINNYALTLHLKQAQNSNSIPGHFHPDVF